MYHMLILISLLKDAMARARKFSRESLADESIMCTCGIREFLARSIDHNYCGNVLNLPNDGGDLPPFIRFGFLSVPMIIRTDKSLNSHLCDDIMAFHWTKYTYCGPGSHIHNGPKVMLHGFLRAWGWHLLMHGGFVTWVHHDTHGQLTWITCQNGAKLWFIIRPKGGNTGCSTRDQLHHLYDKILPDLKMIPAEFKVCSVLLEPGQVL